LALWFIAQEREPEPVSAKSQRTFEIGNVTEELLLEKIKVHTSEGEEEIGGWLWTLDEPLTEPVTGEKWKPGAMFDRQREVSIVLPNGRTVVGHLDALTILPDGEKVLFDAKSTQGFTMRRLSQPDSDLNEEVFARELVIQVQMYMKALRVQGDRVDRAFLGYFSKENSSLMFREVRYDPDLVAEGIDRLTAGLGDDPPEPDWAWTHDEQIPLRCEYCLMKFQCANERGFTLEKYQPMTKKGEPKGDKKWKTMKSPKASP
jgi:hypothetical protein